MADFPRGDSAVLLLRFLEWLGIDLDVDTDGIMFADEHEMTQEQLHAFRILYVLGVFRGNGNNDMQPLRTISRAELAALLFRVSEFIDGE